MGRIASGIALAALLAGCGQVQRVGDALTPGQRPVFDGQSFRTAARADRDDRQRFTATARPVSASPEGALQAAAFEATRHCIELFGTSRIDWIVGPDAPAQDLPIDGDTLTLSGRCQDMPA